MRHSKKLAVLLMAVAAIGLSRQASAQLVESIANSPHNLAALTGNTDEVCVFCHTPHAARAASDLEAPLWNKPDGPAAPAFQLYDSSTLDGTILTVGSVSAACLTCHDGTQAMDTVINSPGTGDAPGEIDVAAIDVISGIANLGRDLTNDHPVGAPYGGGFTTAPATQDPDFITPSSASINGATRYWVDTAGGTGGTREKTDMILYNRSGETDAYVECGSCHDPHVGDTADTASNIAGSNISFMRIANAGSAVCLSCHVK